MLKIDSIRKIVLALDLYGQPPQFRIKQSVKFSTYFGVFFTVSLVIITLTYLIIETADMLKYLNPSVVSAQMQVLETPAYPLLADNFTIAITVGNLQMASLQTINKHFTINMKNCIRERITNPLTNVTKVNSNCTVIPMETCSLDNFKSKVAQDTFKNVRFGTVQCIQKDYLKSNTPVLQGAFSALVHQYLLITLEACVNTTTKNDCSPIEEIKKGMEAGYYHIYYTDNLIRMDQPGRPFEELISQISTTFSIYSSKQIYHEFIVAEAKSDVGLIVPQYQEQYGLIAGQFREAQEFYNQNYIVQHLIKLDFRNTQYNRSYIKLQTILGKVGGLWSVLVILSTLIIKPLTNILMNISIVNKLFQFSNSNEFKQEQMRANDLVNYMSVDEVKEKNKYKNINMQSNKLIQSLQLNKNKRIEFSTIEQNQDFQQYISNKHRRLKLSNWEIIKSLFGCKSKNIKFLNFAEEKFYRKLNIVYIIEKLNEIEKLKCLLLNENQNKMFNFIQKPVISTDLLNLQKNINLQVYRQQSTNVPPFMFQEDQPILLKFWSAFQAYQQISNQREFSTLDNQLLQYLDDDTRELFSHLNKNQFNVERSYDQQQLNNYFQPLSIDYNIPDELMSNRQNIKNLNND